MKSVKQWVRDKTPAKIKDFLNYGPEVEHGILSFSQFGEDLVLNSLLLDVEKGFYVDIGAYHPIKFSNTYFFYKRGWRGINIDALPGTKSEFDKIRPRDVNIEGGVSNESGKLKYYSFRESLQNTFDKELADKVSKELNPLVEIIDVKVNTLKEYLDTHLTTNQQIDFLSIDVENYDLNVLKSNDWIKYRPSVIVVEDHSFDMDLPSNSEVANYLKTRDYNLECVGINSLFFVLK